VKNWQIGFKKCIRATQSLTWYVMPPSHPSTVHNSTQKCANHPPSTTVSTGVSNDLRSPLPSTIPMVAYLVVLARTTLGFSAAKNFHQHKPLLAATPINDRLKVVDLIQGSLKFLLLFTPISLFGLQTTFPHNCDHLWVTDQSCQVPG